MHSRKIIVLHEALESQTIMHSRKIIVLHEALESMSIRVPKTKLQRIEETLPSVKEILVSVYHQYV